MTFSDLGSFSNDLHFFPFFPFFLCLEDVGNGQAGTWNASAFNYLYIFRASILLKFSGRSSPIVQSERSRNL